MVWEDYEMIGIGLGMGGEESGEFVCGLDDGVWEVLVVEKGEDCGCE